MYTPIIEDLFFLLSKDLGTNIRGRELRKKERGFWDILFMSAALSRAC
jgi:hypothetical protein